MSNEENVCPQAWGGRAGALAREVRRVQARPPPGVKLLPAERLTDLTALIEGPAGTPYEGGSFAVVLSLPREYPAAPPRARFATRIFHPNVSARGEVCVNTLAREWRPELGLAHALQAVRCLLIAPNPDSALNAEAAALLRDHYPDYFARARLYTDIHAKHPTPPAQEAGGSSAATDVASDSTGGGDSTSGGGGTGGASGSGAGGSGGTSSSRADGPAAKRERRAAGAAGAPRPDRRRILKRL